MSRDIWKDKLTADEAEEVTNIGIAVMHMAVDFADKHDFDRDETLKRLIDVIGKTVKARPLRNFRTIEDDEEDDEENVIHGHIEIKQGDEEKFHRAYNRSLLPLALFLGSLKCNAKDEELEPVRFISSFLLYLLTDVTKQGVDAVIDDIYKELEEIGNDNI